MTPEQFKESLKSGKLVTDNASEEIKEEIIPQVSIDKPSIKVEKPKSERINPLVQKIQRIPGETFKLPSRGIFYRNGELDSEVINGELVVYPMTGYDELLFRSPDALFQGTAISNVIKRCVPTVLKPLELSANDVDFLLTCIRKVTYGENITIKYKCTSEKCQKKDTEHEYHVSLLKFIMSSKQITQEEIDKLTFVLGNLFTVKLRPAKMVDLISVYQNNIPEYDDKFEAQYANHIKVLVSIIDSVDGIEDKEMITEWVDALKANLADDLLKQIHNLNNWGVEFKYNITCKDCKKLVEVTTPMNPLHFFMKPSDFAIQ